MKVNFNCSASALPQKAAEIRQTVSTLVKEAGKISELPRFSSPEMVMARTLNTMALRQTKHPTVFKFPKATPEDLKRLTSQTIEDSYKRVSWQNPKDGKFYHILKEGELENGDIAVRILNEDGSFLKNANITPKRIVIIDDFDSRHYDYDMTHGEMVTIFAQRYNPFAKIEIINKGPVAPNDERYYRIYNDLLKRIDNGEQIDFISCSHGAMAFTTDKRLRRPEMAIKPLAETATRGPRVLYSAGNEDSYAKECTNQVLLCTPNVEGVGSLSPVTHKVSDFSASRNSFFTQHYEVGEYNLRPTPYGANITGLYGTDLAISHPKYKNETEGNFIIGKSTTRVDKLGQKISDEILEMRKKKLDIFRSGHLNIEELNRIDDRVRVLEKRKIRLNNLKSDARIEDGKYELKTRFRGTSFSTPVRTAKLALNEMLKDVI